MVSILPLFLGALSLASRVVGDNGCTNFATNASTQSYFQYYRFYDFRNIPSSDLRKSTPTSSVLPQTKSVDNASWIDDWNIRVQSKGVANNRAIPLNYTASNVNIENSTDSSGYATYLSLSTTRLQSSQQGAELDYTAANISHASIRVLARVGGASGAVAGIFTYFNDTTESDIEILTRDPGTYVQYSNQPTTTDSGATVSGSSWNSSLPLGRTWTQWNIYRLDWIPGQSAWYVNGVMGASTKVNVPSTPSAFILNMWSNGDAWSGNMTVGAKAELQIQWVEMVFNVSGAVATASTAGSKGVVCSVDKVVGSPVVSESPPKKLTDALLDWVFVLLISTLIFV